MKGTSKNSFTAKIALILRNSALFKVVKSVQAEYRDSELVRYHDRGTEADAEGISIINIRHFSRLLPLISQILYEGSLSLSAKRKCSCFLLDQFDFVSHKPIFRRALNCKWWVLLPFAFLMGCGGTKSPQQTMVEDRVLVYKDTYQAYIEAENKYLNLLFNLERLPEEPELWVMKRDQMKELTQLRTLMLQSRGELDESIQDWERYLQELQATVAEQNAPKRRTNFRNDNDMRTSPGQLLPHEASKIKKK